MQTSNLAAPAIMSFLKTFTPYFPVCLLITIVVAIFARQIPTAQQMTSGSAMQTGLAAALVFAGAATLLRKP
jgi:hypothetical protein